jgi:hypothetical protein
LAAFPAPVKAPTINTTMNDYDPAVQGNGERLIFTSNFGGSGPSLYESAFQGGTLSAGVVIGAVGAGVGAPVLSADGLTLYYRDVAMNIAGIARKTVTGAFIDAANVDELNSTEEDAPGWLSPDECVMYLLSARTGTMGNLDIWIAKRPL